MNIVALIDLLPDTVKLDTIDFQSVKMKGGESVYIILLLLLLPVQILIEILKLNK